MEYIVTASEMNKFDQNTIDYFGIPSVVLMERAALEVVKIIKDKCSKKIEKEVKQIRIAIVAGSGNNGADGLAIGRLLKRDGFQVDNYLIGDIKKATPECNLQLHILKQYGDSIATTLTEEEPYDLVVDALLGVGVHGKLTGAYLEAVEKINGQKGIVISVDIPSGIDADSGDVLGMAVKADVTVTFAFKKRGLLWYPGSDYAGKVICVDIGITKESFLGQFPEVFSYQKEELKKLLPYRNPSGNKGTFGKVLLIAGSDYMCGACVLSGESLYRMGTGMVTIFTTIKNRDLIGKRIPEAIITTYNEETDSKEVIKNSLLEAMEWASVIAIGPGLGQSEIANLLVETVIVEGKNPLVVDADAINIVSKREELLMQLQQSEWPVILTPHLGEFGRLIKKTIAELKGEQLLLIKEFAM